MWSSDFDIYVYTMVMLLFFLPLIVAFIKRNTLKKFSLNNLTAAFNLSAIYQIIISIVLIIATTGIDRYVYGKGTGNDFTEVIMAMGFTYLIIATFIYVPIWILLNLVNWVTKRLTQKIS
jgi:hypothetical protein